jgi:hypothetical protein
VHVLGLADHNPESSGGAPVKSHYLTTLFPGSWMFKHYYLIIKNSFSSMYFTWIYLLNTAVLLLCKTSGNIFLFIRQLQSELLYFCFRRTELRVTGHLPGKDGAQMIRLSPTSKDTQLKQVTSHQVPAVVAYWAGLTKCSQL